MKWVESLFDFVKSNKSVKHNSEDYIKLNFRDEDDPEALADHQAFLKKLMIKIKPHLKFSNWGSSGRIIFVVSLTYYDMVTDGVVTYEFYRDGNIRMMNRGILIYVVSISCHIVLSLVKNKKRSLGEKLRGVLLALCLLSPAAESYEHWQGGDRQEGDVADQKYFMYFSRAIEIVFESCPQAVSLLQVTLLAGGDVSTAVMLSLSACLVISAIGITDINIFFEMNKMSDQKRGPGSHVLWGLLPTNAFRLLAFQFSTFLFHLGYLASSFLTLAAVALGFHLSYVFAVLSIEYIALLAIIRLKNGHLHFAANKTKHNLGAFDFLIWFFFGSVFLNSIPFAGARIPPSFGGRLFVLWIIYRLGFNFVVFDASVSKFGEFGIAETQDKAMLLMQIFTGVAVIGYLGMIAFARDSHRYQLYSTRQTGKEHLTAFLSGDFLVNHYASRDEQAACQFLKQHPSYFNILAMKNWIQSFDKQAPSSMVNQSQKPATSQT